MMKKRLLTTALSLTVVSSFLFSCSQKSYQGITLDAATEFITKILAEQNNFKVELTNYSFSSFIEEYVMEGWIRKDIRKSLVEVNYRAPYLIDDEKTEYLLLYKTELDYPLDVEKSSTRNVKVTNNEGQYVVTEGSSSRVYSPTTDSSLASFITLPSLINSNSIESLSLCLQWMNSIGTPAAPNKTNYLTSFEALSDGEDECILTFKGESLPIASLYDDENSLPAGAVINSLTVFCNKNIVSSYSSKYTYVADIPELELEETEIQGEIAVDLVYGS